MHGNRLGRLAVAGATAALIGSAMTATAVPVTAAGTTDTPIDPEKKLSHFLCYSGKMGGFKGEETGSVSAST